MKRTAAIALVVLAGLRSTWAFPSWMGVYGDIQRHVDTANPGAFSILMNQDYYGLQAEVGIQVNNGNWVAYPMSYAGNVQGNSKWTFTPGFQFPVASAVKYYFHGFDKAGNHIYDSRSGQNYSFGAAGGPPMVHRIDHGSFVCGTSASSGTTTYAQCFWVDFAVKNLGQPQAIGIMYSWDNWNSWTTKGARVEQDLGNGEMQWGVDLQPIGAAYYQNGVGLTRWYPTGVAGYMPVTNGRVDIQFMLFYRINDVWYWDSNGGQNFHVIVGNQSNPNDTDNDGLPDQWEISNLQTISYGPTDNPDGDGAIGFPMDNMIEYLTGNHPLLANDPMGVRLLWAPSYPTTSSSITISYTPGNEGNPLFGKPIYAHIGKNGWKDVYDSAGLQPNGQNGRYEITVAVPADATELNLAFTDKAGHWDNNGAQDWKVLVRH